MTIEANEHNTPPHEPEYYEDFDIEDADEVYEVADEDELNMLLEQEGISAMEEEEDVSEEEEEMEDTEEGDEAKANPLVYSNHTGSVFCCALSPCGGIGASGGEDDKAFIWDVNTGETIFECTEHKDSVTTIGFNYNGILLATGDMSGFIQVWKVATQKKISYFETEELNFMCWHPSSNWLFAGTNNGVVWMWFIHPNKTELNICKTLAHAGVGTECGSLTQDGKRLCVGFTDGSLKVIDLKSGQTLHSMVCHYKLLSSISAHQDNNLIITGSMDGNAKIINANIGKELMTLSGGISSFNPSAEDGVVYDHGIEVVSFCPSFPNLAVTATLSGIISIWDVSSNTIRHHIAQGCGASYICWHPKKPFFITAGLDGSLRVFDVRSADLMFRFKGHKNTVLECAISGDASKIISSSDDGTVRILSTANLWPQ